MRPAQLVVIPGTFNNSAVLARLMSTRASGGGAGGLAGGDCGEAKPAPSMAMARTADIGRSRIASFSLAVGIWGKAGLGGGWRLTIPV